MPAVVGFLVATVVTVAIGWLTVGRQNAPTERAADLADLAGRHVSILGGLAGFAVTGMVLLVTLGRNLPDSSSTSFTTLVALFFVAYIGFTASGLMFANVPADDPPAPVDVAGALYMGAATLQFFTIGIGWFALRPLFETYGLTRLSELAGWLLPISTVSSYGLLGTQLRRSGYLTDRTILAIPVLAIAATVAYGVVAAALGLRSADAALDLIVAIFVVTSPAFAALTGLPALVHWPPAAAFLGRNARMLALAYVQGATVFVGFLLLAVLGLA